MAARRIVQSTVNWSAMAEKVSDAQRPMFNAFKLRSDSYLRKVSALPENPPAIDWSYYQQKVAIPGLVETFKAKYESLEVPYPGDNVTQQIVAQQTATEAKIAAFVEESNSRIAEYKALHDKLSATLPFDQMTMEDYVEAFPENSWNANSPTMWPHVNESADAKADH